MMRRQDADLHPQGDPVATTRHFIMTGYAQQGAWSADAGYKLRYLPLMDLFHQLDGHDHGRPQSR